MMFYRHYYLHAIRPQLRDVAALIRASTTAAVAAPCARYSIPARSRALFGLQHAAEADPLPPVGEPIDANAVDAVGPLGHERLADDGERTVRPDDEIEVPALTV